MGRQAEASPTTRVGRRPSLVRLLGVLPFQQGVDVPAEDLPDVRAEADVCGADDPLRVEDDDRRERLDLERLADRPARVERDLAHRRPREADLFLTQGLFDELADLAQLARALVFAQGDDHDVFLVLAVTFDQLLDLGQLGQAGGAPGGPEVDQDDLAGEVGPGDRAELALTVKDRQRERGRGLADQVFDAVLLLGLNPIRGVRLDLAKPLGRGGRERAGVGRVGRDLPGPPAVLRQRDLQPSRGNRPRAPSARPSRRSPAAASCRGR